MNGTMAVLFLVTSLSDMVLNYCHDGCVAKHEVAPDLALSAGGVIFADHPIGSEAFLRYDFGHTYGPFHPAVGVSLTNSGLGWVGVGATYTYRFLNDRMYARLMLMPGLYTAGSGPNIGSVLEFRSGLEYGYLAANGWEFGIAYDHRSNAYITSLNPGMETLQLRVSIPLH